MQAAGELAQLAERQGELVARGRTSCSADGSSWIRLCSSRSCSAIPTSRCCAPSCRLRSSRRRSASPAATIRSRDACSSSQPRLRTPRAGARSRSRSRRPRRRPRPARGRRRATRRRRARRPACRPARPGATARSPPGVGQHDGAALRVGVGCRTRAASRRRRGSGRRARARAPSAASPPRIVPSPRNSSARPLRASRERSRPARNAAGTATSEQAASQSRSCERVPAIRSYTSSAANSARAIAPGDARQQRAPAWPGGAPPAACDHDDGRQRRRRSAARAASGRSHGRRRRPGTRAAGCPPRGRTASTRPGGSRAGARRRRRASGRGRA